jgi:hypothetical protein
MTWSIYTSGDRDVAKRSVDENQNTGGEAAAAQHQAAKEFILRELESAPAEASVSVSANGHADTAGNRSVSISLSASPKPPATQP